MALVQEAAGCWGLVSQECTCAPPSVSGVCERESVMLLQTQQLFVWG